MNIFDQLRQGVNCATQADTLELGRLIALELPVNQVLALKGDLGAGKTTLTKGIAWGLGIDPATVTSPTFNLYSLHRGKRQLVHLDGYRLSSRDAAEALLIDEFLEEPWLVVVEWPERGLADWMLPFARTLQLTRNPETHGLHIRCEP